MTPVRPLMLLAVVLAGLLGLKSLSLVDEAATLISERADAAAAPPADDGHGGSGGEEPEEVVDEGPAPPAAPPPSAAPAPRAAPTTAQLGLERRLAERRRTLDQREAELDTREQLLSVAELRVDDRVTELEALRDEVRELLGMLDDRRQEQVDAIVAVYSQLEPDAAARILTSMRETDETTLLLVAEQLQTTNARKFAAVMAEMDPGFAAELTFMLRMRAEPPETTAEAEARLEAAAG
ncbi:MotE family protein [Oceanicaulis sp.]|jgi:flagellar motility protein MotE (MotC chaperone)|uniref:MotE family protein n=1 Tax=Oceanicaulis sp. TaxID=1924941 RepID=UPI003F6F4762